jgi:uncharacterized membrane protein YeiH
MKTVVLVVDLAGTFVFALSGALAGVERRLDLFGVLVLSFAAGCFGGIARDVLIGAVPPASISDLRYLTVAVIAGLVTFRWHGVVHRWRNPVLLFDGAGLAFFAASGTQKAIAFGLSPIMAALLGMLTGIGGGITRDVLLAEVPAVLRGELYAVAALAGASVVVLGDIGRIPPTLAMGVGLSLCFGLRMMAIRRGWRLPTAAGPDAGKPPAHSRRDGTTKP